MQAFSAHSAHFHFLHYRIPLMFCVHEVHQHGDHAAQLIGQVHADELILTMAVPEDASLDLIDWAHHRSKQLGCSVVFDAPDGLSADMHLVLENAVCVSYEEHFVSNGQGSTSFTCQLSIVAPRLTLHHVPFDNHWTGALTND